MNRREFLVLPSMLGARTDRVAELEAEIEGLKELLGLMFGVMQAMAETQMDIVAKSNRNALRFDQRLDELEERVLGDVPDKELRG